MGVSPGYRHYTRSALSDAGWGEVIRQIDYKCQWTGKKHIRADRFEPSTQTCSACGARKTGEAKLRLSHRIFRCACGSVMDRDANAAMNLRRVGLEALDLNEIQDVGQAMPERVLGLRPRADACGEASGGRVESSALSHAARKQEPISSSTSEGGQPDIDFVELAIRATAGHKLPDGISESERSDIQFFLDADMSVFASDPDAFDAYDEAVREEYSWASDQEWRMGRSAFARSLLEREHIFGTFIMREKLEYKVRANLSRLVNRLSPVVSFSTAKP